VHIVSVLSGRGNGCGSGAGYLWPYNLIHSTGDLPRPFIIYNRSASVEIVPYLHESSAVLCEVGSLACHVSQHCLELSKPLIFLKEPIPQWCLKRFVNVDATAGIAAVFSVLRS
jgi:hypothetical protein